MQVKQLLLKLKQFGVDISALQSKDVTLEAAISEIREQIQNIDVSADIQEALEAFATDVVDTKDQAVLATIREEIAQAVAEINTLLEGKADKVHTHEATDIIETEEKQFVSQERKTFYDENTAYTNDMATVNALGGIAAGTTFDNMPVNEVLTKLLYPYVAPVVSASSSPNGGTYECGNTQTVTNIRANVTKKSEKIKKVEAFNGGSSLGVKEGAEVANGGTFDFPVSESVSANKNFSVRVTDMTEKFYTVNTGSFNFVYPYYVGICDEAAEINEDLVKGLTKKVEGKGNKTQAFTCNFQRMVFAYPKSHGALKQILDPNNFDVTGTFGRQEITINGLDGTPQVYYVYVNSASTVSNFSVRFNY